MARAHAANACVQSDSIKGLAQSIAKPAYHRLLTAEPALRRAVPTLIIAFLVAASYEGVQRAEQRATQSLIIKLETGVTDRLEALLNSRVDANLAHQELSVGDVARRHRLSPRQVQRLFEASGLTFSEYLQRERLATIHLRLQLFSRHGG